jgi:hypothetical protein
MNFVTKEGASREEILAAVESGWEAMMSGATKDVAFLIDGPGYHDGEGNLRGETPNKNDHDQDQDKHNVLNSVETIEVVEDVVICPGCEEEPCV